MGRLYVAATPIGNLREATPRLQEALERASFILAEDTRVTRKLLSALNVQTRAQLLSCHQYNEREQAQSIAARLLAEEGDAVLVTDAGTPGVSDPGAPVVAACAQAGVLVQPIAGPSAVAAALSVSGFDATAYAFYGFLPREGPARRAALTAMARSGLPLHVVYESPHRVQALLADVERTLPGARASLSCDLTKLHELTLRGGARELLAALQANPKSEKGEYVCVLDLRDTPPPKEETPPVSEEALLLEALLGGLTLKEAVRKLSSLPGHSRNSAYQASLRAAAFLDSWGNEEDE